jgi:hypothetical protein
LWSLLSPFILLSCGWKFGVPILKGLKMSELGGWKILFDALHDAGYAICLIRPDTHNQNRSILEVFQRIQSNGHPKLWDIIKDCKIGGSFGTSTSYQILTTKIPVGYYIL